MSLEFPISQSDSLDCSKEGLITLTRCGLMEKDGLNATTWRMGMLCTLFMLGMRRTKRMHKRNVHVNVMVLLNGK